MREVTGQRKEKKKKQQKNTKEVIERVWVEGSYEVGNALSTVSKLYSRGRSALNLSDARR